MLKKFILFVAVCTISQAYAQPNTIGSLRLQILKIIEDKNATIGVAIQGVDPMDTISLNGNSHLPLQSVFKLPLAMAVLHQVDQQKFQLNEPVKITSEMVQQYDGLWSPMALDFPHGGEIELRSVLNYTVAKSDNMGADILLAMIGGPDSVNAFIHSLGITDFHIEDTELVLQSNWDHQFNNWTTPLAANQILSTFYENQGVLSSKSHDVLLKILIETQTGATSLKGKLPKDAVVAHKTGYSGKNSEGVTGALNDVGIVFTFNDSHYYISVFVSNSTENDEVNHAVIAQISALTWMYFNPTEEE